MSSGYAETDEYQITVRIGNSNKSFFIRYEVSNL